MSLGQESGQPAPWPIALEPSIRTCPVVMYALISVRRMSTPAPYELVRHSVLARLPEAPFGQRFPLPAAEAGAAAPSKAMAAHAPAAATRARLLNKYGAHKEPVGVALDAHIASAGARD